MVLLQILVKSMETLAKQKADRRKQMKLLLKAMDRDEKKILDHAVCENLFGLSEVLNAKQVYGYMALSWETGTIEVLERLWERGTKVALPRVFGSEMDFFEVSSLSDLSEGTFHILEPGEHCEKVEWADALMLVPGLAFSRDGRRLGKGGGYYDKYLEKYPSLKTVALAYDFQIAEEIPVAEHDKRVDVVVTESGICICRK